MSVRLHAALAQAERPVRARSLAYDLGLSPAEVTAELRRLQDLGVAISSDRRWSIADTAGDAADDACQAETRKSA